MKNPLSNEAFADWCEKQGDREYNYWGSSNCACAQYAEFLGLSDQWHDWLDSDQYHPTFWSKANQDAARARHNHYSGRFSALAARLRETKP